MKLEVHVQQEGETPGDPGIWNAAWGDDVQVGDLLRVTKLGGPVRVRQLRKFFTQKGEARPYLVHPENDDGRWIFGAIVEDHMGQQFHLFISPHEAVFVAVETPTESDEGDDDA